MNISVVHQMPDSVGFSSSDRWVDQASFDELTQFYPRGRRPFSTVYKQYNFAPDCPGRLLMPLQEQPPIDLD